jgi:predicted dehydrogenase
VHARQIAQLAQQKGLVVEAGYEARYSPVWEYMRQLISNDDIGRLVTVRSIALWNGDPRTWYYDQQASGGMPLHVAGHLRSDTWGGRDKRELVIEDVADPRQR